MHNLKRRIMGSLMAVLMSSSTILGTCPAPIFATASNDAAVETEVTSDAVSVDANQYGLVSVNDGNILHAWNWKFSDISKNLEAIAEAGYSVVQTSPLQPCPEFGTNNDWWKTYQPYDYTFGTTFGTEEEFKELCAEAKKYGISIIVDVIANHVASEGKSAGYALKDGVPEFWRGNSGYFHGSGKEFGQDDQGDKDRSAMVNHNVGLADVNTNNADVQARFLDYMEQLLADGASGFRFDTAKHIGTSYDTGDSKDSFWKNTVGKIRQEYGDSILIYGEILNAFECSDGKISYYVDEGMKVTESQKGWELKDLVNGAGTVSDKSVFTYTRKTTDGISANNLITWVENHDTYLNNWGCTGFDGTNAYDERNYMSNDAIVLGWSVLASRTDTQALFYARPDGCTRNGSTMTIYGDKGMSTKDTTWKSQKVAAINNFKNAMNGQTESCKTEGKLAYVQRGDKGVVVANFGSSDSSFSVSGLSGLADGTYKDASGQNGEFTVSGGKVSGQVKGNSFVVLYDANVTPVETEEPVVTDEPTEAPVSDAAQISVSKDSCDFEKAFDVDVKVENAEYAYYSYDGADWTEIKDGKATVTVGEDAKEVGDEFALYVKAKGKDGKTKDVTETYTYTATATATATEEPVTGLKVRVKKSDYDAAPYIYLYTDTTPVTEPAGKWPGAAMKEEGDYYVYSNSSVTSSVLAIFSDGKDTWQDPTGGEQAKGYAVSGYVEYANKTVSKVEPGTSSSSTPATVSPNAKKAGKAPEFVEPGNEATQTPEVTTEPTGEPTTEPTSEPTAEPTGEPTEEPEIVASPSVEVSVPDQSEFDTDTMDVTLTLKDAQKGTYTIDGGITKTFVDTTTVTIGEGKIADTDVTLEVTATDGNQDYKYTYTYKKVFNPGKEAESQKVTVATSAVKKLESLFEVVADASEVNAASNDSLAAQYATNAVGLGAKKTINVDGEIDDWDSSMLIAQGAANDDPRCYKDTSMHEVPIDLYALYGAYDDENLYLMWEFTNVQDVVATGENYPLTQGVLYQTQEVPMYVLVDTGDSATAIGNNGKMTSGDTFWGKGITVTQPFNRWICMNTKGGNNHTYAGSSAGIDEIPIANATGVYEVSKTESKTIQKTGVSVKYGMGIVSDKVCGINDAYGTSYDHTRVVGDVCDNSIEYVDFNKLGHKSDTMDFHYEMKIPLSELGTSADNITNNGIGVMTIATFGKSAMDCLPYDVSMNDNADQDDTESQPINSYEKSDPDEITASFARIGKGDINPQKTPGVQKTPEVSPTPADETPVAETPAVDETPVADETPVVDETSAPVDTEVPATDAPVITEVPATDAPVITEVPATEPPVATAEPIKVEISSTEQMVVNFGADKSAPQASGTVLTLEAKPMNTTGTCQYQFAVDNEVVQAYSESATYQWNATAGNHTIQVAVKDANGNTVGVVKNYRVEGEVVVPTEEPQVTTEPTTVPTAVPTNAPVDNGNVPNAVSPAAMKATLKFSPKTSVSVNKKVTITPVIENYKTGYTYSIIAKKSNGTVKAIVKDSTAASVTWKPTVKGTYTITINAKDSEGNLATQSYSYKVTKISLTAKVSKKTVKRGKSIKFTAKASSVSGTAKFKYVIKKGSKTVKTVKYSKKKTYTWKTKKTLKAGTYKCIVYAKDSSGTTVSKTVKFKVKKK